VQVTKSSNFLVTRL